MLAKATLILRVRRAEPRERRASPAVVYITPASAGNSVFSDAGASGCEQEQSLQCGLGSRRFCNGMCKELKALTDATQVLVPETGATEAHTYLLV